MTGYAVGGQHDKNLDTPLQEDFRRVLTPSASPAIADLGLRDRLKQLLRDQLRDDVVDFLTTRPETSPIWISRFAI